MLPSEKVFQLDALFKEFLEDENEMTVQDQWESCKAKSKEAGFTDEEIEEWALSKQVDPILEKAVRKFLMGTTDWEA